MKTEFRQKFSVPQARRNSVAFFRSVDGTELTVDGTEFFPLFFRSGFFRSVPFPSNNFWTELIPYGIKYLIPWKHFPYLMVSTLSEVYSIDI